MIIKKNHEFGDAMTSEMDIHAIMTMLRHRYPVLLVDRVVECVPGVRISGFKNVTHSECNHGLNGQRSLPCVLFLEALAQLAVILTFKTLRITPSGRELMFFAGIDKALMVGSAVPGDRLDLEANVLRVMPSKGIGKFRTCARIAGLTVAEADMMAAMRF